jgi:Fic family protein
VQVELFDKSPVGRLLPISVPDVRTGSVVKHFAFAPNPLPPTIELTSPTLKILSEADRALGRLDARVGQLPNPGLLVRPALTREAVSTSALEGTYALLSDVLESEYVDDSHRSAEVREVRKKRRAVPS